MNLNNQFSITQEFSQSYDSLIGKVYLNEVWQKALVEGKAYFAVSYNADTEQLLEVSLVLKHGRQINKSEVSDE